MSRAMLNRLAKLEPRAVVKTIPNVILVRYDETAADALARFRAEHGTKITGHHGLIVLPDRIATPEAEADFVVRFYSQQRQLAGKTKT